MWIFYFLPTRWAKNNGWIGLTVELAVDDAESADLLSSVVGGAHQRAAFNPLKADFGAVALELSEFFQGVIAVNGQVFLAGLEVLANGEDVDAPTALIAHDRLDFVERFTQADHDPGLGQHVGVQFFSVAERGSSPFVMVLRLDEFKEARDSLNVMV